MRILLIVFLAALSLWWGVSNIAVNQPPELKRVPLELVPDLEVAAESAISLLFDNNGAEKLLFEKEGTKILPVASLTKLMTAKIVLENYEQNQIVRISEKAAGLPGNGAKRLNAGQVFRVIDLLYPTLMESNNTAAYALAELVGQENFVALMNLEAQNLGMADTQFLNPTGLDEPGQYSTVQDLAKLTKNLLAEESFIWHILSLPEIELYSSQGEFVYTINNTNELLGEIPLIIGGKTGETPQAGGCLLLVSRAPEGRGYLINVVLNSPDRFSEMKRLIEWDEKAYSW